MFNANCICSRLDFICLSATLIGMWTSCAVRQVLPRLNNTCILRAAAVVVALMLTLINKSVSSGLCWMPSGLHARVQSPKSSSDYRTCSCVSFPSARLRNPIMRVKFYSLNQLFTHSLALVFCIRVVYFEQKFLSQVLCWFTTGGVAERNYAHWIRNDSNCILYTFCTAMTLWIKSCGTWTWRPVQILIIYPTFCD